MGLLIVIGIIILLVALLSLANRSEHELDDLAQRRIQFNDYLRQKELLDKQAAELQQRRDDKESKQQYSDLERKIKELTDLIKKTQDNKR